MMAGLPAPAVLVLEEARLFAEHADELAALEEDGWRFARSDAGVFVAESGKCRRFDADLGNLVHRCTPRPPKEKP